MSIFIIFLDNNSKALPLLSALVNTETFNQAEVWLKHAECLHALNELESAAMSYTRVLSLAPHHTETRLTLASLYNQMGYMEDALALLDTGNNCHPHNPVLILSTILYLSCPQPYTCHVHNPILVMSTTLYLSCPHPYTCHVHDPILIMSATLDLSCPRPYTCRVCLKFITYM